MLMHTLSSGVIVTATVHNDITTRTSCEPLSLDDCVHRLSTVWSTHTTTEPITLAARQCFNLNGKLIAQLKKIDSKLMTAVAD